MAENADMFLAGFDFGSTTSHAVIATATVRRNAVTGRIELGAPSVTYRSPIVFTPYVGADLDVPRLEALVREWARESGVPRDRFAAGGAIVTGLAARAASAKALAAVVEEVAGDSLIATADDPHLESWLAFQGNCAELSRAHPDRTFLNLDIGGGTTNTAAGRAGIVERTAAAFLGARHLQFREGTYELVRGSDEGRGWLEALRIPAAAGSFLSPDDIARVVRHVVDAISRMTEEDAVVTFSGGVGELVYRLAGGDEVPAITPYGDLGVDLARGLLASPRLARDVGNFVPAARGRATVYGLALHHVEISGATIYLPEPERLPLRDLPILGRLPLSAGPEAIRHAVERVARTPGGACLEVEAPVGAAATRALGGALAFALERVALPQTHPLVLFVSGNVGRTLGNYATRWGRLPVRLVVIDELENRSAHYATLGRPRQGVVPVSFYGMNPLTAGVTR